MNGFSWLGVIFSTLGTTLALGGWVVMSVPYFDNAPYLQDLRRHSKISFLIGVGFFLFFFVIFYLGAQYLDEESSGPLLAFTIFIILLPGSMLLGSETWERYNPKGMNKVPAVHAVAIATGIGMAEIAAVSLIFMILMRVSS